MYIDNRLVEFPYKGSTLKLVDVSDAPFILSLRTNSSVNEYVSVVDNDLDKQKEWIKKYKEREFIGSEYYFIIKNEFEFLGTIRIYDIDNNQFSWGSWMVNSCAPIKTALESMLNIYYIAFDVLKFKVAKIEVRNKNNKVLSIHKKIGARIIKEDVIDTFLELTKDDFYKNKKKFEKLLK